MSEYRVEAVARDGRSGVVATIEETSIPKAKAKARELFGEAMEGGTYTVTRLAEKV